MYKCLHSKNIAHLGLNFIKKVTPLSRAICQDTIITFLNLMRIFGIKRPIQNSLSVCLSYVRPICNFLKSLNAFRSSEHLFEGDEEDFYEAKYFEDLVLDLIKTFDN